MREDILYYLLQMKMYLFKFCRYMRYRLVAISEVLCLIEGQTKYMTIRFTLIRILKYVQCLLQHFVNALDIKIEKAQILKNYPEGQQTIIICPKIINNVNDNVNNDNLMISDLVDVTNSISDIKDDRMGNYIYMKFELDCPVNGIINLKDHLITYKDIDKLYSHTIDNILTFNNIHISDQAKLNIKIFSSGKLISKSLTYEQYKDKHLSEINKLLE